MKVWIVSFGILLVLAEFYQWVQEITLPLPVFIVGGVVLAIASNYDKFIPPQTTQSLPLQPTPIKLPSQPNRPVSFTIRQDADPSQPRID